MTDSEFVDINHLNDAWKETISGNTGDGMHVKEIKIDQVDRICHDETEEDNYLSTYSYDTKMLKHISECNQTAEVINLNYSTRINLGEKLATPDDNFEAAKTRNFLLHEEIPTGDKYFPYTDDGFKTRQILDATPKRVHTEKKPPECTKYHSKSKHISRLVNNGRSYSKEKHLVCTDCGFKTEQKENFARHKRTHRGEVFECAECGFKTAHKDYLKRHFRTHTGEKPFECTGCDFKTADKGYLVAHIRTHTGEKPFECTECGLKTTHKKDLVNHKRTHTGEVFECAECGFKTAHKDYLVRHFRTHTGEKPFECTECGFKTAQKGYLVAHIRTHTGEKPFKCTECGLKTAHKTDLVKHKRTHSGHKPFKCTQCGFKTAQKGNLERHKGTHIAGKLFVCTECDFNTRQRAKWLIHKHIHIKEKPSDFAEYKNLESLKQIETEHDSLDILEFEDCNDEIKPEISERQLFIDNKYVDMYDIKTEPM